ncbi:hypothetical protein P9112_012756 [Eukaryota sp. TZLM1-RC]
MSAVFHWENMPKFALVISKKDEPSESAAVHIASFLHSRSVHIILESHLCQLATFPVTPLNSSRLNHIDFVVTVGGDGTVIHAAQYFPNRKPPLIAFNAGSLGFLTPFLIEDFPSALSKVLQGGFCTTLRHSLECYRITDAGRQYFFSLNEVAIERSHNSSLTSWSGASSILQRQPIFDCYCNDLLITSVVADGVLLATSTGSTAYSLSAGGSCVHPAVPAILLTPICPQSKCFKSITLPGSSVVKIKIRNLSSRFDRISIYFDGRSGSTIGAGDSVEVCISNHPLLTVCRETQTVDWFESLRDSLNWNKRIVQKSK